MHARKKWNADHGHPKNPLFEHGTQISIGQHRIQNPGGYPSLEFLPFVEGTSRVSSHLRGMNQRRFQAGRVLSLPLHIEMHPILRGVQVAPTADS
jgi:hypothetical protein